MVFLRPLCQALPRHPTSTDRAGMGDQTSQLGTGLTVNHLRWMAVFSCVFVVATAVFYRLGLEDVSLIYANIVNLVSRILFSAQFISQFYNEKGGTGVFRWASVRPRGTFVGFVILSGSALQASAVVRMDGLKQNRPLESSSLRRIGVHLGGGVALAIISSAVWWFQTGRKLVTLNTKSI